MVRKINIFNVNSTKKLQENDKNKVEFHFSAMTTIRLCWNDFPFVWKLNVRNVNKNGSILYYIFSISVQFSCSVVSASSWPHGLQHARLPCVSPTPGTYSNSYPSGQWCHPTISFSVFSFSRLQSFPTSGSFPMSQFFTSGNQSIGVSALVSILPMNIQDWFPLEWTGWISLQSKGLPRVFSNTTVQASILWYSAFFIVQPSHPYKTTGKTIALTRWTFVGKIMSAF